MWVNKDAIFKMNTTAQLMVEPWSRIAAGGRGAERWPIERKRRKRRMRGRGVGIRKEVGRAYCQ